MSDGIFFCLMAVGFYSIEIVISDWKLSHISPRFLTLCYAIGIGFFALASIFQLKPGQVVLPHGKDWIFILLMIIASFGGAVSHFAALNKSSGAVLLAIYYTLLPVGASVLVYIFRGGFPSIKLILAWILAAAATILLSTATKSV